MGKIQLLTILILLTHCISVTKINGQDEAQAKVDFKNAPVLFREKGKAFQQVIASYRTQTPGKISFIHDGKEILKADIAKGDNRYLLTFPAVTRPKKISVSAKIDDKASEKYFITLIPPKNGMSILFSIHILTLDIHGHSLKFLQSICGISIMPSIIVIKPIIFLMMQNFDGHANQPG